MITEINLQQYYLSKKEIDIEFLGKLVDRKGAEVIKDAIDAKSDANHSHNEYLTTVPPHIDDSGSTYGEATTTKYGHVKIGTTSGTVSAGNHTHSIYTENTKIGYVNGVYYSNENVPTITEQTLTVKSITVGTNTQWVIEINNLQAEQNIYVEGISCSNETRTSKGFNITTENPTNKSVTLSINALATDDAIYTGDILHYDIS